MMLVDTPLGFKCWMRKGTSDEKVFKEIFETKIYKKKMIGFDVEEGEEWLDLGANCGYFSQYALEKGASVLAVDADPENKAIIERLKIYTKFKGLVQAAVVNDSYQKQKVQFFKRTDGMTWKSSLFKVANSKKVVVDAVKFSSLVKDGISVKMDIEGAEIPILKEFKDWSKIKKMVFEWSFDKEPRMIELKKVIDELKLNFRTVHCVHEKDLKGLHQTWQGGPNQFELVYCIK